MLRHFFLAAAIAVPPGAYAQDAAAPVTVIGEFSNMQFTAEHAYGYTVQLWRQDAAVFGLFLASAGLAGDTPTGSLDNVKFDARSGRLSFQAKLTLGAQLDASGKQQPSRDFFAFEGTLKPGELTGSVKHTDAVHPNVKTAVEQVTLRRQSGDLMSMLTRGSYTAWRANVAEILKRRGPKW